ncbi:NAD(P)H-binding protein [Deinococcus sp. Leaf326]|uniref:NAD(P)H-binding protein n=1 Tax=Deinococcus sp. Leaf326 TaxID=1736338 RepID=UPI0006FDC0A1|nr:NAD(P)H-binding protein [Deinococcus sp. Leaf326]KQR31796.1 NAD(P)-dependent oxidoreductase [Deinococcus sp. Leaf326]
MIIVTGATGRLGRLIVEELLRRVPAERVGVSVRDPGRAQDLEARGVRVQPGDFADVDALSRAFGGASQVLLMSSGQLGDEGVRLHGNVAEAARQAGAGRVVYTSHMAASPDSLFPPMWTHAATEAMLAASGLAFTALRNGFYADSARFLMGDAFRTGEVRAPQDGPVSWTTHADLAGAAAAVLTGEAQFDGPTPPLVNPEALDLAQLADLLAESTGRAGRRAVVPEADFAAELGARGLSPERAAVTLGLFAAAHRGEFASPDPTLGTLLGRAPESMRAVLARQLAGA